MKSSKILENLPRDSEGRIILDNLVENVDYEPMSEEKGKRSKNWMKFTDGQVLVKYIKPGTFEDYAEMIVEEMCKQIGLESAHYDLAILNGKPCVITWDFRKEKEYLVSGKTFTCTGVEILINNNQYERQHENDQKELNNLDMIRRCLSVYMPEEAVAEEMEKFDLLFGLNCFGLNGDIHLSNWSVLYNAQGERVYRLSPNYDCGSYFRFNLSRKNLSKHLRNILRQKSAENIKKIVEDDIFGKEYVKHNSLNYTYHSTEELGMSRLEEAFRKEPERFASVLQKLYQIDPYEIIVNVQKQTQKTMPEECADWLISCVEANQHRIERVIEEVFGNYKGGESNGK